MSNESKSIVKPVKYLVCVDGSEHAKVALRLACSQARKRGGNVDLLHILEPADFQGLIAVADKMRVERRAQAEALLNDLAAFVQENFSITPSLIFREGKLESEVLSAVEEDHDANILVMGVAPETKGRHGDLIGWLAAQLGSRILIPLLLVPAGLTDQQIEELS